MTEKRFTIDKDGITIIDNCADGLTECKHSNEAYLLCNFLNEQHKQIRELKNEVFDWKASAEDYLKLGKSLKKENEQLKQQLQSILKLTRKIEDCTHDMKLIGDDLND